MKPLPEQFTRGGFTFTQLKRTGPWALYRKAKQGAGGLIESFEVVKPHVNKAGERFGKSYPERESYPPDGDWGKRGFSYKTEDIARNALREKSQMGQEGA